MKKNIAMLAMIGMLFLIGAGGIACGKGDSLAKGQRSGICGTYTRFTASFPEGTFESFCDSGFLSEEQKILMFQEYESKKVYPLCSEVYCEHEPRSVSNPNPTCEAAIPDVTAAAINGHELYVFQESEFGKTSVLVRNLYESGYRELVQIPYSMTICVPGIYNLMKEDKAYLIVSDTGNSNAVGIISQQDYPTVILELELKTGKYQELFRIHEGPQIRAMAEMKEGLGLYFLYGTDEVRFEADGTPVFLPGDRYDTYYYIDLEKKNWKEISSLMPEHGLRKEVSEEDESNLVFVSFSEQGINVKKGRKLYEMDPKTEKLTLRWTLPEEYESFSSGQGTSVLTMYMENKENGRRGLLQVDSGQFQEVDYGDNFLGIEYFGDGYFCCYYSGGDITEKKLIYYRDLFQKTGKVFFEWTR